MAVKNLVSSSTSSRRSAAKKHTMLTRNMKVTSRTVRALQRGERTVALAAASIVAVRVASPSASPIKRPLVRKVNDNNNNNNNNNNSSSNSNNMNTTTTTATATVTTTATTTPSRTLRNSYKASHSLRRNKSLIMLDANVATPVPMSRAIGHK